VNLICRLTNHRWKHDDRTRWHCGRCGKVEYGMGGYDDKGEIYFPPPKYRSINGGRMKRV
jgi:hypothetical protein